MLASFCVQAKQDAADAKTQAVHWADAIQRLSADPVETLGDGHAAIATVLDRVQTLEEQQQLALDDIASKEHELSNAESRLGEC